MSLVASRRRVHIRCSKETCKRRYTLAKHPDEYVRGWKCAGCGGTRFREIKDRAREACAVECQCGSFVWPSATGRYECSKHRRGSAACLYRRDGTERLPGDEDYPFREEYEEAQRLAEAEEAGAAEVADAQSADPDADEGVGWSETAAQESAG